MYLIKDDKIISVAIIEDKVVATIEINGKWVSNPTLQQMYDCGWEEYTMVIEEELPTIENLVEGALREGIDGGSPLYTINKEFKVLRLKDINTEDFIIYNDRVNQCIAWAYTQPHKEIENN
jgi:uncharacterized protein YheU (UPF0270 family)